MYNLLSINTIRELMDKHGVTFSKGLGQNFLIDQTALQRIVKAASPEKDDFILEVGPGVGTLTANLAQQAGKVVAVEIDSRLFPILHETLADFSNVSLLQGDILKTDLKKVVPSTLNAPKVVANLPYYITTPVIFYLLESGVNWQCMVLLIQKEVAERLVASPGSRLYGASSVTIQARSQVSVAAIVKAGCFLPRPKVDSAVIVLKPFNNSNDKGYSEVLFRKIVQKSFAQRRKKIFNSLTSKGELELTREIWHEIFRISNIDESVRAEKLSVSDFERLTETVEKVLNN